MSTAGTNVPLGPARPNVVYSTDLVRGLDVYQVDVPGHDLHETDDSLLDPLPLP